MEAFIILFLLVLIVLIVTQHTGLSKRLASLEEEIFRLRRTLTPTDQRAPEQDKVTSARSPEAAPGKAPDAVAAKPPDATAGPKPMTGPSATASPEPFKAPESGPRETEPFTPPAARPIYREEPKPVQPVAGPSGTTGSTGPTIEGPRTPEGTRAGGMQAADPRNTPHVYHKPGFYDRHPDLEKFIGENLISKIGIGILVLAIGFFVKYAIDNDWITPAGRVGIGLLCGGILVFIAHLLRNSYKAFSSVLVGGGLAIFYFSIALAYHQYHLFGQTPTFIIMLFITGFAVVLSLFYDREELAIISLAGGFITPFLASNGSGNYQVLFSYLLILNTGLLVIAYHKSWRLLNLLAFLFTAVLFASWLVLLPYDANFATYRGGFFFATAFYILFFLINIAYTVRARKKFIASDFGTLLANTCLYFAAGLYLLVQMNLSRYEGLLSAALAVFNLAASYFLFRREKVDTNILYLLIGITLSFVSITAPIQLHGHYITLFWGSETVLLYWLYQKSGIRIIGVASVIVSAAMLVSLVLDWEPVYLFAGEPHLPIVLNKGFITGCYAALCCLAVYALRKRADAKTDANAESIQTNAYFFTGAALLFISGALETGMQVSSHYPNSQLVVLYELLYAYCSFYLFTLIGVRAGKPDTKMLENVLLGFGVLLYLLFITRTFDIQQEMLEHDRYNSHFAAHWAGDILVILCIIRLIRFLRQGRLPLDPGVFSWLVGIVVVIFFSVEIQLLMNAWFFREHYSLDMIQRIYIKTGLPIIWGLCSFLFMWLGMRFKFKPLRILSLALFSLTLLKLFLFDIRDIPVAGKIAAFFCLGVLLLVVSFMYQRLKKIIIEDEEKKSI